MKEREMLLDGLDEENLDEDIVIEDSKVGLKKDTQEVNQEDTIVETAEIKVEEPKKEVIETTKDHKKDEH
jgi:hypothetical protein